MWFLSSIFEGFFTLIYKRKILLAVVSHLECEMGPGPRIENIQNSVLPGLNLIHRVNTVGLCIVFFLSDLGMTQLLSSNSVTSKFSRPGRSFPIGPENLNGPVVMPSKCWNRWRNQSSLK